MITIFLIFWIIYFQVTPFSAKISSLVNYTSNKTTQHEYNTTQYKVTQVKHEKIRVKCNTHEYNTMQRKYKGSLGTKNRTPLLFFLLVNCIFFHVLLF